MRWRCAGGVVLLVGVVGCAPPAPPDSAAPLKRGRPSESAPPELASSDVVRLEKSVGVSVEADAALARAVEAMALGYERELPTVPQVTAADLLARFADKTRTHPVLVDCRERGEQRVSMLAGAITREQLEAEPGRYADAELVVYCTIGYRSSQYVGELRERGMSAANLHGGVLAWAHAGRGFVDSSGASTRRVHVYGAQWDLLPAGYESER